MIKKEYIQPTVKEIKINLPVVLTAESLGKSDEEVEEGDIQSFDAEFEE
jgi:hypothetical protein